MLYPVFSYDDGTEVTASKPDKEGKIILYIERYDEAKDDFVNATFVLPNMEVKSFHGYNEQELKGMIKKYFENQDDIISYIIEKEQSAI